MARRYDSTSFLKQLQAKQKADIQKRASEELAEQLREQQEKERGFRSTIGMIESAVKIIDPTGGALSAVVDMGASKAGRAMGYGADPDDIKLAKRSQIFGGRKAQATAKEGLKGSIAEYEDKSIADALTAAATSKIGKKITAGAEAWGAKKLKEFGKGTKWLQQLEAWGLFTPQQKKHGGMISRYNNGGMVQKFASGGFTFEKDVKVLKKQLKAFDSSEADKIIKMLKGGMSRWIGIAKANKYINERKGTTQDISGLMETQTEGQDVYTKNQEMADLVNLARGGGEGSSQALNKLAQIARANRPELRDKPWADLRKEISDNLGEVNMYGGAYQDVQTGAAQEIQGMKGAAMAGIPTTPGMGQRQARIGQQTLSSGLQDIYARRATGTEDAISGSFGGLDATILGVES